MIIIKKHIKFEAMVLFVLTMLTSCQRTELCHDHFPKAALSFEWQRDWEIDFGMSYNSNWDATHIGFEYDYLKPALPEWINLVKFKEGEPDSEHYLETDGGEVVFMEKGDYSFLFYNGDTEYIVLSDIATWQNARASATPRSRSSISYIQERHPDTRSTNPPDILYSSFIERIPEIPNHETKPLPVTMHPLVYTYLVRYEFEHGLEYVHMARGALAGMAESVYLRDGSTSEESVIILYDCEVKDYGCEAHVRSFGVPGFTDNFYFRSSEAEERPYTLNLELLLTNGKTLEFNYDIAEQIKNQPRGGVITISGIRVEDEDKEIILPIEGSFDVDLSGWGEVDVDLPI